MANAHYVIQGGVSGRERLRLLAEVMAPTTRALFGRVGIGTGAVCLDIGCGGGDVSVELAAAVGGQGRVLGVDLDATKIDLARREAAQRGLSNVAFEVRDVSAWEPDAAFDVVYVRFLLTHLSAPAPLLEAAFRHLRVGGVIVVEDIDFRGHFYEPECPALGRYVELYTAAVRRRGGDPEIGPKLPGLLRDAKLDDVQMQVVHPAALEGGMKLVTCVTMESIADTVIQDGLASPDDVRATIESLYAFARDPHTVHGGPRVFQVWGRRGA